MTDFTPATVAAVAMSAAILPGADTVPARGRPAAARRVAFVAPDWRSLVRLRGDLIADLLGRRHRVLCLAPFHPLDAYSGHIGRLEAMGAECSSYPLEAGGLSILADRRTVSVLEGKLAEWQPHVVIAYQPKPMLLGALAAKRARVPRVVPLVASLGPELGAAEGLHWRWRRLARAAFAASHAVVVHNRADLRRLMELRLLPSRTAARVVPGAGVDLERHTAQPLPAMTHGITFLVLSQLQREKGVITFCAAARQIRAWRPDARFILAGPDGTDPGALAPADLADYAGCVELRGDHDDVRPLLGEAHVVVLPSVREGMSRTLLEALANARPIVTTDIPGCRETIDELVNGILVPPQDADALAAAMQRLIARRDLLPAMGRASRLKAERLFDVRSVNADLLAAMGLE
ncbi:MAG: glycosyltransferase family 4 protein [Hyphomicrobiaceae bacterium]|nr:glycosyltransferase family 4 protein [Hyphomicrobiaceae bacterium]